MAVPKLRFKEFDQKWGVDALQDQIDFLAGYAFDSKLMSNEPQKYQLIKMSNVYQNQLDLTRNPSYWTNIDSKIEKFLLKKGDIVLTLTGTVGKTDYGYNVEIDKDDKFLLNQRLVRLRAKQDLSDSKFIQYRISTDKFFYHFFYSSKGGTGNQSNVSIEDLKLLELNFPSKEEQTKIASFLSAVDEKISQLTQKHALLSQYKQGMMQKLFSQQIRFKADDGSEFGEWEEVKFSGIFKFHQTNSYSRALLAEYGEIMNIHYGDIHTKFSMLFDVNKESVPFLNDEVDTSKIAKEQFLKVGDLVIADASEDYKDIGKSIEVISLNNQKVVAGLHTYIARPVKPFALGFCGYMMQTFPVREQIKKLATGISVLGISKTNLGKVELKVPSLEEQTKIANFLSAIDQKIGVVAQQIEQAKTWKKGLLQQMFV
ncbi:restriction endonuclease subunit S [Escherichia coli]|uniref:restriction endonuclease subunit S n=1 Tax=Escherichia coli TaxID=562 RepID=UPI001FF6BE32|nr:restriction endonuclease subunit S [Escherichia coli]